MEMESSRRSAPRPPAPGPKKARLAEDDRASNGLAPRPPAAAGGGGGRPTDPRIRAIERERDREGDREDPERGGGAYRPQQHQQHIQELVAQYKTGLAELTFNSKPIITNLTIIAGENLHAAKEFAATICANILEVPSDQKLPSLYLLDSIVKNIGRDYIKFFASRLPEVFCKAYKQVDSSVHPGMRHLFGTWKGVFPLAPLQMIGKELGFPPIGSASSGSTAPKPDSQMRPSHSIHINPKYLEARQRLQQSTRAKEARNDNLDSTLSSETSDEGSERLVTSGSSKQWTDLPSIQRPQREQPSDPVLERKGYRDLQFSTNIPQQSDLGVRRVGEKIKERDGPGKSLYAASYATSELSVNKRDGFDVNHVYGNYRESGSTQANRQVSQLHRTSAINSSQPMSKNWKNSEEEEFLWDDMNSRSTDYGVTSSSMNGGWNTDDADMPASFGRGKHFSVEDDRQDLQWNKLDGHSRAKISRREDKVPFFEEIDERLPQPRQQDIISRNSDTTADSLSVRPESARVAASRWPSHEPLSSVVSLNRANLTSSGRSEGQFISSSGGLSTSVSNALPATGLLSHSIPSTLGPLTSFASKSRGMFGQQIQQPFRPPSPSSLLPPSSAVLPRPKSHSSTDHDHLQSYSLPPLSQKPMQPSIQLNKPPLASVNQDSIPTFALKQSQQSCSLLNSKPSQNLENSSASSTLINQHPLPFLQQPQPDLLLRQTKSESEPSTHTQKPPLLLPSVGSHQTGGLSRISHLNNVSPDVSGHSGTNDLIAAIMKSGVALKNPALNNIQPPLPSGPPPTHFLTSSGPLVTSSSVALSTSHSSAPSITPLPISSVLPPLPPGPPPSSSISGTSSQISSTSGVIPNPLSSLLSSLVAKGLITPSTESPPTEAETSARPSNLKSGFSSSTEVHIPSTSAAMTISSSPSVKELSLPDSSALVSDPLTNGTSTGMKDLIGIDFRPEIIREFHPSVINSLNDDLRYQCKSCGLRFELQQRLQSHLDWHASKSSKESTFSKVSRKWFADALSWVVRSVGTPYGPLYAGLSKVATPSGEECEPSVPADESQCICALCGEPFEDLYSLERDEWMYKGTVYLELPDRQDEIGSVNESEGLVPIVHAKCMSKISGNTEEDEKI